MITGGWWLVLLLAVTLALGFSLGVVWTYVRLGGGET